MLDKEPKQEWFTYPWVTYSLMIAYAIWGGLVNLIQRYKQSKNRRFSLTESIGELTISAFAGILVLLLCDWANLPISLMGAFAGIAGHMGSRLIYVLESWLKEKLGKYLGIEKPLETPESPPSEGEHK